MIGIVIAAILILTVYGYHREIEGIRRLEIYPLSRMDLKTGDVVFTRRDYVSLIEPMHYAVFNVGAWAGGSGVYTHAGVVVNVDGRVMMYQTGIDPVYDYNTGTYKWLGPVLIDPRGYLMAYPGEIVIYRRHRALQCTPTADGRRMTLNPLLMAGSITGGEAPASKTHVYCVQLVADFLQQCGVKLSRDSHRTSFRRLISDLEASNEYMPPVLMLNAYANFKILGKTTTEIHL